MLSADPWDIGSGLNNAVTRLVTEELEKLESNGCFWVSIFKSDLRTLAVQSITILGVWQEYT
jgi:hypothetical protein